jgi:SulP family sulfate permease
LFAATVGGVVGLNGPQVLPIIALFTGFIIFAIYLLRGERYIRYIPASVVHGFAAGVAFSIAATQLREAFGIVSFFKPVGVFFVDFKNVLLNLPNTDLTTFVIFLAFFVGLIVWKEKVKSIPGVLPATILGIVIGLISKNLNVLSSLKTIGDRYGDLSFTLIQIPNFSILNSILANPETFISILKVSFVVAIIAILETLITAKIGDKITGTRFNVSREARGLSIANIFSGLFGGLPATGVFIRTGLNIKSGATEKYAGVIAGLATGLGAVVLIPFIKFIPMSVIAAMLMMTAIGLIDVKHLRHMFDQSRKDFYVAMLTVFLVLAFDAGVAVLVGTVISLLYLLEKTTDGTSEISYYSKSDLVKRVVQSNTKDLADQKEIENKFDTVVYSIGGFLSYIDAEHHIDNISALSSVGGLRRVGIRMRNLDYADFEALEDLGTLLKKVEAKNVSVFISSASQPVKESLLSIPVFQELENKKMFFANTTEALS